MKNQIYNTIVALATPTEKSAIHIIRLSGPEAYLIINKICDRVIKKENYKIQMANIMDDNKEIIDNVLLMKFISPKSFTGEDMIEINCHGSVFLANKIIQLTISNGAKYAKPGEFSQRALFNNKMNLINVESVNNLINATNDLSIKIAINGINKTLTNQIDTIAQNIFLLIGQIEVNIDYPEYEDVVEVTNKKLIDELKKIIDSNDLLINKSKEISKINNGYKIAIIGKPNVGKSSILNNILKENKAIVSNIAGTTRDIVEGSINYNGKTFIFFDTAGIRNSVNKIEKIGISKTKKIIKDADLILLVIDASSNKISEDQILINSLTNKDFIVIGNKSDKGIKNIIDSYKFSAKKDDSAKILKLIDKKISEKSINKNDYIVLQSARQIGTLSRANNILKFIIKSAQKNDTIDSLVQYLHEAYDLINNIVYKNNDIDFIDKLFANFCIGK